MPFCPHCGAEVKEEQDICMSCGKFINEENPAPVSQAADTGSFGWAVLGFCIPIVGLVLFLVWKDTRPGDAKNAGWGALIGFILGVVSSIISALAGIA